MTYTTLLSLVMTSIFFFKNKDNQMPKDYASEEKLIKYCKKIEVNDDTNENLRKAGWDDETITQTLKYILMEKKLVAYLVKARMNDQDETSIKRALQSMGWDNRIIEYLIKKYLV